MKRGIPIILLITVIGCTSKLVPTSVPTKVLFQSPFPTLVIDSTTTETDTPDTNVNATVLPSWTALPTVSKDNGLQLLYQWLEGIDECLLPCWASITPGKTSWNEARHWVEPISGIAKLRVFLNESCNFGTCNEISWSLSSPNDGHGYIYSQLPENKIHAIMVEITDPVLTEALALHSILTKYGKPEILLFSTEPDLPGDLFLELIVVYPKNQFIMRYSKYAELSDKDVISCENDSYIELIILDNQEQLASLNSIANAVETKELNVDVWHKPVEEAMGITLDEFYEIYRESEAPCITTPISIWVP